MNSWQRVERDNKIVALRARGFPERAVAERFNITPARVGEIMEAWRSTKPKLRLIDPLEIIDQCVDGYQADMEHLSVIAENAGNSNTAVGAINARMAARDRIIALLQTTGVLPHDLGKLRVEVDVRFIAQQLVTILNKYDVPENVQQELIMALQQGEPLAEDIIDAEPVTA
jgi:hypothetical protein